MLTLYALQLAWQPDAVQWWMVGCAILVSAFLGLDMRSSTMP
jgi:hypothetical protein